MILILENSERKTTIYLKIMRTVTGEFGVVILEKSWEGQIAHCGKINEIRSLLKNYQKKYHWFNYRGNFQRKLHSWEPSTVCEYLYAWTEKLKFENCWKNKIPLVETS